MLLHNFPQPPRKGKIVNTPIIIDDIKPLSRRAPGKSRLAAILKKLLPSAASVARRSAPRLLWDSYHYGTFLNPNPRRNQQRKLVKAMGWRQYRLQRTLNRRGAVNAQTSS
jgi:hypothetical protein